jgi:hypothetical protein
MVEFHWYNLFHYNLVDIHIDNHWMYLNKRIRYLSLSIWKTCPHGYGDIQFTRGNPKGSEQRISQKIFCCHICVLFAVDRLSDVPWTAQNHTYWFSIRRVTIKNNLTRFWRDEKRNIQLLETGVSERDNNVSVFSELKPTTLLQKIWENCLVSFQIWRKLTHQKFQIRTKPQPTFSGAGRGWPTHPAAPVVYRKGFANSIIQYSYWQKTYSPKQTALLWQGISKQNESRNWQNSPW